MGREAHLYAGPPTSQASKYWVGGVLIFGLERLHVSRYLGLRLVTCLWIFGYGVAVGLPLDFRYGVAVGLQIV